MSSTPSSRTILVVEDDPFYRRMIEHILSQHGYTVALAASTNEAWEIVQHDETVQMVVTDWVMPEHDGLELIRRLRTLDRQFYVILLTIKDNVEDVLEGLAAGADDYLTKPFTREDLLLRLRVGEHLLTYEQQLRHSLAMLSQLKQTNLQTGLLNRYGWFLRAKAELNRLHRQKGHAALFLLALDDAEHITATFDQKTEERLIQHVAHILEQQKREYDILGHWDETSFALFLPETTEQVVRAIAERIRRACADTPLLLEDGNALQVVFSLGITTTQWSHTYRLERLLHDTHLALSEARLAGRYQMRMYSRDGYATD